MARWGARVVNRSTGSVQIDDLYANMALISKGTQTAGSSGYTGTATTSWTFTATQMPVIAFSCSNPSFINFVVRDDPANTWRFNIVTYVTGSPVNVTCYEFGQPPVLGPGWGMRIKRGGQVFYDSRHRYARVATTLRGDQDVAVPSGTAGPGTTLTSGRTYAVMMGNLTGRSTRTIITQGGTQQGYTDGRASFAFGVGISGNVISSQNIQFHYDSTFIPVPPGPPPPVEYDIRMPQYSWAILDVTGY